MRAYYLQEQGACWACFLLNVYNREFTGCVSWWMCVYNRLLPWVGKSMQTPFREWLAKQKEKLHHKPGTADSEPVSCVLHLEAQMSLINAMQHAAFRCCSSDVVLTLYCFMCFRGYDFQGLQRWYHFILLRCWRAHCMWLCVFEKMMVCCCLCILDVLARSQHVLVGIS